MQGMGFTDERPERVIREALEGNFSYIESALRQARDAKDQMSSGSNTNGDLQKRMRDNYDLAIAATIREQGLEAAIPLIREAYGPDDAMAAVLLHLEREDKS